MKNETRRRSNYLFTPANCTGKLFSGQYTDKAYFEAHAEHNFAGYFLSHAPLINRLNLEEIIGGSYLGQGTPPAYKEVYIGLKRTVVRLDYGFAFGRYSSTIQGFRLVYTF